MAEVTVVSLGGSIIVPDAVDIQFLTEFCDAVRTYLDHSKDRKLVLVTGGGAPARKFQEAYRSITSNPSSFQQDLIGIAATRLNAQLLFSLFEPYCSPEIVTDPTADLDFSGQVLIAAGWKPGFSTDTDAVYLAQRFKAEKVINLSNIAKVYTADPKSDPNAVPLDHISWKDFRSMVGDTWIPGKNVPFDPVAAKLASEINLEVICAGGRDISNTMNILEHREFIGTVIGPE